ncbi:MAG TPA: hypothetical protein VNQ31_01165 [Sphingomonadaceae bacterium]|nr:hypothetical protein [Sphingomonadaceae bacterium]
MTRIDALGAAIARAGIPPEWRDDLRLFALVWAGGFLFVSALLA